MVEDKSQEPNMISVGIIGGGKVGQQWLKFFTQSQLTKVNFLADRNPEAPGMVEAKKEHIPTYTDFSQALKDHPVDFIYEVTGVPAVVNMVRQSIDSSHTQIITHDMAFVLNNVVQENHQKTTHMVLTDILGIKKEIENSLDAMEKALTDIKQTTSDLRYLALNARIEAARAGEHGHGFDVVAQQVDGSAKSVREMTAEMVKVNGNIASVIKQIDISLQKLN